MLTLWSADSVSFGVTAKVNVSVGVTVSVGFSVSVVFASGSADYFHLGEGRVGASVLVLVLVLG